MEQSNNSLTPKIVGAVAISAVLLIGIYVFIIDDAPKNSGVTKTSTSQTAASGVGEKTSEISTSAPKNTAATSGATYKDGTYNAAASYTVPRDFTNSIKITLTVKDGKITNVTTNSTAADRESERYISDFESSVSSAVVGQNIDGFSANRIGGASLTTEGFVQALQQIQTNAKS